MSRTARWGRASARRSTAPQIARLATGGLSEEIARLRVEPGEGGIATEFLSWRSGLAVKAPRTFTKVDGPAGGLPEFDDPMEIIREREKRK